ncbi:hypothetical protein GLOIN_2v1886689 [Rhizophagus irregularis DAOM 181602=DAOM 197198]|nr:hypothetical protein GLOIN_2v1886689 [Rhizophagus irregularis DAOM 181602=DAOM 197198]
MINAPDGTPPPGLPAGATGATVISAHNVHADEDWSLADGCPVDAGSDSVRNYYRKINKYASWARISDREKRIQFIRGLTPENKLEMKRLGLNRPLNDELIETLEEIETERNNLLLGEDIYNQPITKTKPKAPAHQNITTEDIDKIVNSRIQALQQSVPNLSPVSSSGQENITKADLQEAIAKSFQETMSRATKILDNKMSSAKLREIPLEETIRKVLHMAATEAKIVSQNDVSSSSKDSDEFSLEEESLDDPMEIDFVKKKEPKTSVATVKCKIRRLKIPAMTLNSGAEPLS